MGNAKFLWDNIFQNGSLQEHEGDGRIIIGTMYIG
jgi:hypothetical protein